MKLCISGSRDYPDEQQVVAFVRALPADTMLLVGGARGVDTIAERTGRQRGLPVTVISANWSRYGTRAGILRNADMLALVDGVVAFHFGASPGTRDMITRARRAGKLIAIFHPDTLLTDVELVARTGLATP